MDSDEVLELFLEGSFSGRIVSQRRLSEYMFRIADMKIIGYKDVPECLQMIIKMKAGL